MRGAREGIRTHDLLLRRQTLYPLSYAGNGCHAITEVRQLPKRHRVRSGVDRTRRMSLSEDSVLADHAPFMSLRPGTYSQCQSS